MNTEKKTAEENVVKQSAIEGMLDELEEKIRVLNSHLYPVTASTLDGDDSLVAGSLVMSRLNKIIVDIERMDANLDIK